MNPHARYEWWADMVGRIGLALAFLYPPYAALMDPVSWLSYFPQFVRGIATAAHVPDLVLLHGFGVVEVVIALWILFGRRLFYPSLAATVLLVVIVVLNLADFEVLFRDLSIAALSLAFTIRHAPGRGSALAPGAAQV